MTAITLPQTSTTGADGTDGVGAGRVRALRVMYVTNIVGAGLPGLAITVAPTWADANIGGGGQDPVFFGMLGAIWLAIGVLSIVGLRHPVRLSALFAVQVVYKSVWIAAVALPMLARGERLADVVPYAVFFGLVVLAWAAGAPFAWLLARRSAR